MTRVTRKVSIALLSILVVSEGCGRSSDKGPSVKALPDSAFRVEWKGTDLPPSLSANSTTKGVVTIHNISDQPWRDGRTAAATEPGSGITLSYRWLLPNGAELSGYKARFDLTRTLGADETMAVPVEVTAPSQPGTYELQFDLVQELVAWFEVKGAAKLVVPVTVTRGQ